MGGDSADEGEDAYGEDVAQGTGLVRVHSNMESLLYEDE